ncbi:MAG: outer membrane lipoprotein-sorting protein [Sedimentisphaerales bacterium]|nr:outer membrane lipoprotein-sorting protein [Sedimentisphaerales bacterium]
MKLRYQFAIAVVVTLVLSHVYAEEPVANEKSPAVPQETSLGKDLSVDEIVERANRVAYYQGRDGSSHVSMTIKDAQGQTRTRKLIILRKDMLPNDAEQEAEDDSYCGEQKIYAYFTRPADVNRTTFLVWKYLDKDDDRWIYLPALDLKKRISATDKRTSFVGTHFYYEDVSGRNIDADTHELVETTDNYFVLNNVPEDPKTVEFSSFKVWIHKETFLPVKTEYYNQEGNAIRVYHALKVETIQDFPTVTQAKMQDLLSGGETIIEYSKIKYNIDLPDSIFTERYLRNAPREYLR